MNEESMPELLYGSVIEEEEEVDGTDVPFMN